MNGRGCRARSVGCRHGNSGGWCRCYRRMALSEECRAYQLQNINVRGLPYNWDAIGIDPDLSGRCAGDCGTSDAWYSTYKRSIGERFSAIILLEFTFADFEVGAWESRTRAPEIYEHKNTGAMTAPQIPDHGSHRKTVN
jgi:hypothetical protein